MGAGRHRGPALAAGNGRRCTADVGCCGAPHPIGGGAKVAYAAVRQVGYVGVASGRAGAGHAPAGSPDR
ncbi:hypothetical protein Vlu01_53910 [Micromonospora lutea]|uniref:Uncharacterized protein n=1 Tax=Micromonospora lutea TaxID=419825 RepID=A0ABQ4J3T1_9ACTN|nr:hypothetical protein Vlu01_53910 [Micromonospora lutea]